MRNLFHMTLLMLSFSSFAITDEVSTVIGYIEDGRSLSPAFYEDVMNRIMTAEQNCSSAVKTKERLLGKLKSGGISIKDNVQAKSKINNTPVQIVKVLKSQIDKINGAKNLFQLTPSCELKYLGSHFPTISSVFEAYSISGKFDYVTSYLQSIIDEVQLAADDHIKVNNIKFSTVTNREKEIYKLCTDKLSPIVQNYNEYRKEKENEK